MSVSPGELYDACSDAAASGPRWRRGRPVLWLTAPYVRVGSRTWRPRQARVSDDGTGTVWGFDARQCGQIADALLPVMAAREEEARRLAVAAAGFSLPDGLLPD